MWPTSKRCALCRSSSVPCGLSRVPGTQCQPSLVELILIFWHYWIELILSGVEHALKLYHPLACRFLHSPSESEAWGEQRVLVPAGPGCLTLGPVLQLLSPLRGSREKLHCLTWVFGGWFYLLLGVGGCRAFACSGFGFFVYYVWVFVFFFLSAVAPHLGFPPFLQNFHYNNHLLNCAWEGASPAGGSLVANKPCSPSGVHWPSPEQSRLAIFGSLFSPWSTCRGNSAPKGAWKHLQGSSCVSSTDREREAGYFTPEEKAIIPITAIYCVLSAARFRKSNYLNLAQVYLHSWGTRAASCSGEPRAPLAPRDTESMAGTAGESPALGTALPWGHSPAGRFGEGMLVAQLAVTAPAVRASTGRALQTLQCNPPQHFLGGHPFSWSQSEDAWAQPQPGLRAERSDRTVHRASQSHCKRSPGACRSDGWPEEPPKTQGCEEMHHKVSGQQQEIQHV